MKWRERERQKFTINVQPGNRYAGNEEQMIRAQLNCCFVAATKGSTSSAPDNWPLLMANEPVNQLATIYNFCRCLELQ